MTIALMVNEQDEVLTLHRYRFAIDKWGYELLGGIVEVGEDPAATAKREAVEESGWRPPGEPTHLASFEPMPGMTTAQTDVFMWKGAERVGEPTDTEEAGRLDWVPADRVHEPLKNRKLLGGGMIIAVQAWLLSHTADAGRED